MKKERWKLSERLDCANFRLNFLDSDFRFLGGSENCAAPSVFARVIG
jgi:hypothetical protein